MTYKDVLLEAPDDIKAATYINSNVDDNMLGAAIRETQDSYLIKILGSNLYYKLKELVYNAIEGNEDSIDSESRIAYKTLLDEYVQPFMEAKVQAVLPLMITFKTRNLAVTSSSDDNIRAAGIDDVAFVQRRYNTIADQRATSLSFFLCDNRDAFPELEEDTCSCGMYYPPMIGKRFVNVGLWLGSAKNRCKCK